VALPLDGWLFVANDFESWYDGVPGHWVSCGAAAISWENAEAVAYGNGLRLLVANFGSNAHVEYSPTWSTDQEWQVSWGLTEAVVLPEIYCSGQPSGWVAIRNYKSMFFDGVTSENGLAFTGCNGHSTNTTYLWNESWTKLNSALVSAGYSNDVQSIVTVFPHL
jgi:hypothetical protein